MAEPSGFNFRAISASDSFDKISCGDQKFLALKVFLQKNAQYYEDGHLARTYGFFAQDTGLIAAYITLVCSEIDLGEDATLHPGNPAEARERYPYTNYPAVKIARLLVDSKKRKNEERLGSRLVDFAFGVATEDIGPRVGCRFLVVDSKPEAIDFYLKCGFSILDTEENKARESPVMWVDLKGV